MVTHITPASYKIVAATKNKKRCGNRGSYCKNVLIGNNRAEPIKLAKKTGFRIARFVTCMNLTYNMSGNFANPKVTEQDQE